MTDEHIVPYSLGGSHVLVEASCRACAKVTSKFELNVARGLWGDARISYNAPSRRKQRREKVVRVTDPHDPQKFIAVPANEHPAGLLFYKMGKAGLLQGLPDTVDISAAWTMGVVQDDSRREKFLAEHPGKLTLRFRHVPNDFGRLLAKIGYGQVLTMLDPDDFRPICLPYIMGEKANVSFVVGGSIGGPAPERDIGYRLSTVLVGYPSLVLLLALVRLYSNTHSPEYHVVVGEVQRRENVERVLAKLGEGVCAAFGGTSDDSEEHWHPAVWPLPYWKDQVVARLMTTRTTA